METRPHPSGGSCNCAQHVAQQSALYDVIHRRLTKVDERLQNEMRWH